MKSINKLLSNCCEKREKFAYDFSHNKWNSWKSTKLKKLLSNEPVHEKNNNLHRRKQSRRSASR